MSKRVAIQGHRGSFHEQAAHNFYINNSGFVPEIVECPNFSSLYAAMEQGRALEIPRDSIDKASLCFTLPHKPGSLAHILAIMSFYEINLTRIQSLPIPGKKWQYFFYVDIKFDGYDRYRQVLSAITPLLEDIRILGEYKAAL